MARKKIEESAQKQDDSRRNLCSWNDHGYACDNLGSISHNTNGSGPWYCSKHFWQMHEKDQPKRMREPGEDE
jgi:hypothetical protein